MLTGSSASVQMQILQDLAAALEEQRSEVLGAGEHRFDGLKRDAVILAALPGREKPARNAAGLAVLHLMQLHPIR